MDKRDHYRIQDEIQVTHETVTSGHMQSIPAEENFTLSRAFLASREIYELELDALDTLRDVNETNRQLGSFLHNLNKRMSLITRSLLADEMDDVDTGAPLSQLSEGGIAFLSDQFLTPGTNLALKLLFTPSYLGLTCYAQVRHCRLTDDGHGYRVGTQFMNLDDRCRHLISRHIIRQQSEERRRRLHQSFDVPDDLNHRNGR